VAETKRSDLAAFLRTRRERITPDMADLPSGPRRRTPGLRREEVAQLAGVGVTWYTWLEQGRPINASTQVLDAIARTLRLDNAEWRHLYRLTGHSTGVPADDAVQVTPQIQEILDQLSPIPACFANTRCDVLAWNAAYAALMPEVVAAPEGERNTLWQSCVDPKVSRMLVNRDQELPGVVAVFRGAYSRHADDPCWQGFVRRLCAASQEFAALWARQDVAEPGPREKIFKHERAGEMRFTTTVLNSSTPETRMVVYSPMDDTTRQAIDWLLRTGN
jgi:hypothetical protein